MVILPNTLLVPAVRGGGGGGGYNISNNQGSDAERGQL